MKNKILSSLAILSAMMFTGCDVTEPIYDATYTITVSNGGNGTGAATVGGASANKAIEGTTVTITATPTGDYAFKQWTVVSGGVTLLPNATTNPATFTMPSKAVEIKAEFEAISRTVTMSNDGHGTAVADPADAAAGQTVTITATPTGDYAFKQWTVVKGGVTLSSATENPATFEMLSEAVEIKAEFEAISRTVTMTNDGHGTAVADPADAAAGQTVTITATPTGDYAFKQWTVVSGSVTLLPNATTNPATFTMPSKAVEIKAEFEATYAIAMSNDGNGAGAATVGGASADKAVAGATVTITATPKNGNYQFKQWVVESGGTTLSSTTTNPATFTMGSQPVEIRAEFSLTADAIARATTIVFDATASDATKTAYTFTLPSEATGAQIASAAVTSGTSTIASSLNGSTLTITSGAMESAAGSEIIVSYTVTYGGVTSAAATSLTVPFTGVAKNAVGGVYYKDGVFTGVVFRAKTGNTVLTRGLVLHREQGSPMVWSMDSRITGTIDKNDGLANTNIIKSISGWQQKFSSFKWATEKGDGWYLPAENELIEAFAASSTVNPVMQANGGDNYIGNIYYWSSSEHYSDLAINVQANFPHVDQKSIDNYVRSILSF